MARGAGKRVMLDLYVELSTLIIRFERDAVPYALCGGMAMAVHGFVRATEDIDILVPREVSDRALGAARAVGFDIENPPVTFAGGAVPMQRVCKAEPEAGDLLVLDLLVVTPATVAIWDSRIRAPWEHGALTVLSRDGLIALKSLRNSLQDRADIARLRGEE